MITVSVDILMEEKNNVSLKSLFNLFRLMIIQYQRLNRDVIIIEVAGYLLERMPELILPISCMESGCL